MNKGKISGIFLKIKSFLYEKFIKINDTPQRVAFGFGIGVFTGIFPGAGPLAALFLAFVFRANRASALAASLLSNTWLSFVTFILAIKTGSAIFNISWQSLKDDWVSALAHWHWQNLFSASIIKIFLPVICGYLVVSLFLGIISYAVVLAVLKIRLRKKLGFLNWLIALILFSSLLTPLYAEGARLNRFNNAPPVPRLLYPINDKVVLSGKDFLEFKWINDFTPTDHYVFKIYKGYNMYESGLVNKQNIGGGENSVKIKSDFFENGQVYTWSLILVDFGGEKSEKSFNSFKVIK
jgi:uncharacterized protein (DUF2062 family)